MKRTGVSPLTGRVFHGHLSKTQVAFIEGKQDITSDVFRAIIELGDFHGGEFFIEGGGKRFEVAAKEVPV